MSSVPSRDRRGDLALGVGANVVPSESARVRLGASTATEPDVLHNLAGDPLVTVRAALALNPAAPPQANRTLAGRPR
jgi:hypothetical protein